MNLLISKPDALGDQFIAAGAVQALRRIRPDVRIVWHVRAGMEAFAPLVGGQVFIPDTHAPAAAEAARLADCVDPLIILPFPLAPFEPWTDDLRGRLRWWAAFLQATSWDASVLAQINRNWVGDFTIAMAPAAQRFGLSANPARQPLVNEAQALAVADAPDFTRALSPSFTQSEAAQLRDLFAAFEPRLAALEPPPIWQPVTAAGSEPEAKTPTGKPRHVLIAPGVGADARRAWGAGNFQPIAAMLRAQQLAVSWIEGPGDAEHLAALPPDEADHRLRFGPDELPQLVDTLRNADLLLCQDTAYVHIAAGAGVPAVAIFGAGQGARFHPTGGRIKIVQSQIACEGCQWHCLWDRLVCVADIPVETVFDAVMAMLNGDAATTIVPLAAPVADAREGELPAVKRRLQDEVLSLNADRFARLQIIQSLLAPKANDPGHADTSAAVGAAAPPLPDRLGALSPSTPLGALSPPKGVPNGPRMEPKVSVIIPMGRPDRIAATLGSLAAQDRKPAFWEIVLVGVEAESVARAHPHLPIVPVVLERNLLPPKTRCLGIERAAGGWLLLVDDDVELAPDCLGRFIDLLATPVFVDEALPPVGAIGFRIPGKSGRFFERLTDISNFWAQQHDRPEDRDWLYSAALLVRADAYRRSGGFNPDLPNGEDVDLTRRIAAAGFRLRYEPGLVARHDHRRDTLLSMWRYFWRNGNAARYFFSAHGGACPFSLKTVWLKAWSDLRMNQSFQQARGRSLGLRTPLIWLNYLIVETSLDWHWQQYLKEARRYRQLPARARSDTTYVLAMIDWEEGREFTGVLRYAWAVIQDFENPVRR